MRLASTGLFILLALTGLPISAQPEQRPGPPEDRLREIDPSTDAVLIAIKNAVAPDATQGASIQDRYTTLRNAQSDEMRRIRRSILGERPAPGQRPPRPSDAQRAEMDKQLQAALAPLNESFLKDLRNVLSEPQRFKLDSISESLDLMPPRGNAGGPNAPGGPPRQNNRSPLPSPMVSIELKDGYRVITSNGLPNHPTGQFPGRGNPNTISAQSYSFRVPLTPTPNDQPRPQRGMLAGVALNGIVFDPGTAEAWKNDPSTGWRIEAIAPKAPDHMDLGLDQNNAHVQPSGAYHYHAAPEGLIEALCAAKGVKDGQTMLLLGWAADGYPIYDHHGYTQADDASSPLKELRSSYRLKTQQRPGGADGPGGTPDGTYTRDYEFVKGSGDLDECNGRTGVTPEFPNGTYYYVLSGEFPFIPRMFHGTPDPSFAKREGPPSER